MKFFITIFTPTYNRANLLKPLYSSLRKQKIKSFEWLIIDDGSTDNTKEVVDKFIEQEKEFSIRYYKVKNGGKQRAINKGLDLAKGDLFFVVDSDDFLTNDSLEKVHYYINSLKNEKNIKFAGVAGLRGYSNEKIIGTTFKGEYIDSLSYKIRKHGISGDKAEIYFTDIMKKFKTPEIEGENFIPEEVYHYRIADAGYKLRYFNSIIYISEYLEDGYTKNINKILFNNFRGYTIRCKELLTYNVGIKRKIEVIGKYSLLAEKKGINFIEIKKNLNIKFPILFIWVIKKIAKFYYRFGKTELEIKSE